MKQHDFGEILTERSLRLHQHDSRSPKGGSVRINDVPGCQRKLTLHYAGISTSNHTSPEDAVLFEEGLQHEQQILYALQREGYSIGRQGISVDGRLGGVKTYGKIDGWLYEESAVVEVKTVPGELPEAPSRRAAGQALVYAHFMFAKAAVVIYKSRTSGQTRSFWLEPDKRLMREYGDKLTTVRANVERKVLPATLHPDVCHRCPYRAFCHPEVYPDE